MRKTYLAPLLLLGATALISCGGKKETVKEPPKKEKIQKQVQEQAQKKLQETQIKAKVEALNKQLSQIGLTGFPYKGTRVSVEKYKKWAKIAAPILSKVLKELPKGYVIEIVGHADSRGPEYPEGNKPGNIQISKERAQFVLEELKKAGLDTSRIRIRGAGSSEPNPEYPDDHPMQRRVTFHVVKE